MKIIPILMVFIAIPISQAFGQLTIDICQEKARLNYPQIKQYELIEKSRDYSLSNAGKAYLPQVTLAAKATYQSDAINLDMPVSDTKTLSIHQSKDQYQAALEVNQVLWDGGVTSTQKNIVKANAEMEKQKLEVELYTIKERVNQVYFGLLLLQEQLLQNEILQQELQTNFDKVNAYIENGVANPSDLDAVKLEQLNNIQRRTELLSASKSYREMLAAMISEPVEEKVEKPVLNSIDYAASTINRPELRFFDSQLNLLDNQSQMIQTGTLPKLGLFVQGGVGKPGMNMLSSDFSPFYIGGIRLSWNISGFYTQNNNLNNLKISKEMVNNQKETFLFNNKLKINQQNNELDKIRELIRSDDEIISLHTNIKNASQAKVKNGVQTVTELLREINAESMAKQQKALHEIQLMMGIYNLKYSTNN